MTAVRLIVILLAALVEARAENTYYASPGGSDRNSGSLDEPFRTVAHGAGVLRPGDTLYLRSGTYAESLVNISPGGTSWGQAVTIMAYPGEIPVICPDSSAAFVLHLTNGKYIVFDGLVFDGLNATNPSTSIKIDYGAHTAHHIRIQNSEVRNGGHILTVQPPGDHTGGGYNEFINVEVHHTRGHSVTTAGIAGFYISSSNNLVDRCRVHDCQGWGIHIYNGVDTIVNNTVSNNFVYNNAKGGDGRGFGIGVYSGPGARIYNNVVWGNNGGIGIDYNASGATVIDNTIYNNNGGSSSAAYGIYNGTAATDTLIENNIVYRHKLRDIQNSGTARIGPNLTAVDPQFINPDAADFHLQPGSPARNRGVSAPGISSDIDGNPRPTGPGGDLGAYQSSELNSLHHHYLFGGIVVLLTASVLLLHKRTVTHPR